MSSSLPASKEWVINPPGGGKMSVIVIDRSLGPEPFRTLVQPFPSPKNDEVVIKVYAVGVNKLDVARTKRSFTLKEHWSHIPGLECTGKIIKLGAQVNKWEVGQEVCAILNGGGYANFVAVPAAQLLPYCRTMRSILSAACLPQAACLVWESFRAAKLSEGKSILVYGRCRVICELAVQVAKMKKATVVVASPDGKWHRSGKPDYVIDSTHPDFFKLVVEATRGGVDIVLDSRMSSFVNNASCLKEGGTMVYVDTDDKDKQSLPFFHLVSKNATFQIVDRRSWTPEYTADVVKSVQKELWPYIEREQFTITYPQSCSLPNVMEAHQFFEKDDMNTVVLIGIF